MNTLGPNPCDDHDEALEHSGSVDPVAPGCASIEMRLREVSQLFDVLDPALFGERDLDRSAEEYIVDSLTQLPASAQCVLVIHLDRQPERSDDGPAVGDAIRRHFARRSNVLRLGLHQLIRRGLISLAIGLTFLTIFFVLAEAVHRQMGQGGLATLLREGLLIVGWVAMWKPLEIILYDWWPILGRVRIHDRLSRIRVRLVSEGSGSTRGAVARAQRTGKAAGVSAAWESDADSVSASRLEPHSSSTRRLADDETSGHPRIHRTFTLLIQAALAFGLILFAARSDWENVFLTLTAIGLTLLPAFIGWRFRVYLPSDFQLISTAFIFSSLFLGSAMDFYFRFPWWDKALHAGSGFLLGIVGCITLFVVNRTDRLPRGVRPSFLCLFGLTFSILLGVLWEIFEFAVDRVVPWTNMQRGETGVADTMNDLIVSLLGAVVTALMGWAYSRTGRFAFIDDGIRRFMRTNRRLFRAAPLDR